MNIAGTRWAGIEVGGPGNGYIELFFGEDGGCTLNNAGGVVAGSWQQFENTIYFELNGKYSEWSGTVNPISGGMHGNAINKAGKGWSWAVDMYEEGSLTPPRTLWGARFNALDLIQDRLGLGLDPGIKRSVLAVQLMGLETNFSCEGHTDWGYPTPVVRFARVSPQLRRVLGLGEPPIQEMWFDSFAVTR